MKRYALLLALAASLSFALIPWSFRYQSTANLWEDDYDLIFDPARIPEIEGSRLYTQLSNFVTGNEWLFSNGSVPFILIGGSTYFMDLYPGLVYDRHKSKLGLDTGLDDPNTGYDLYGEAEIQNITWYDNDANGVYDERWIETEGRTAYNAYDDADYYVGVGKKMDSFRFGLGFMRDIYKNTYTDPENNFTYDYTEEDLTTGEYTHITRASSAGDDIYNSTHNDFIFSIWYDTEVWSVGLRTGYGMSSWKDEAIIIADSAIYTDPADSLVNDYTTVAILDSLDAPQSGNRIPVYLTLFYNYNENAQGRFYLGFVTESYSYDEGALGYHNCTSQYIYSDFNWYYDTMFTYYAGDGNTMTITAGTKHLWNINPRLNFGIGAMFNTSKSTDSITAQDVMTMVEVYDDNDGMTVDPDDYVQTVWSDETWMTKTTSSSKNFKFPVGVEFFVVNPKLCIRLGGTYSLTYIDYTTVNQMIAYEPERTRIEYGDGTVMESLEDPGTSDGSTETWNEVISTTDYVFGLGWHPVDNLQIDLMGFTKLTDMTEWRLSAILRL